MKTATLLSATFLFMSFLGCEDLGNQPISTDVVNSTGTVVQKSIELYIIDADVPVENGPITYYPTNLSDPFKRHGLRIRFSGKIQSDPPSPYPYTPLTLTYIDSLQR